MIHTFEKNHGKIGNSFTRANTVVNSLSLAPKIKQHDQEISEIIFKPNRLNDNLYIKTNSSEREKEKVEHQLPPIMENREN